MKFVSADLHPPHTREDEDWSGSIPLEAAQAPARNQKPSTSNICRDPLFSINPPSVVRLKNSKETLVEGPRDSVNEDGVEQGIHYDKSRSCAGKSVTRSEVMTDCRGPSICKSEEGRYSSTRSRLFNGGETQKEKISRRGGANIGDGGEETFKISSGRNESVAVAERKGEEVPREGDQRKVGALRLKKDAGGTKELEVHKISGSNEKKFVDARSSRSRLSFESSRQVDKDDGGNSGYISKCPPPVVHKQLDRSSQDMCQPVNGNTKAVGTRLTHDGEETGEENNPKGTLASAKKESKRTEMTGTYPVLRKRSAAAGASKAGSEAQKRRRTVSSVDPDNTCRNQNAKIIGHVSGRTLKSPRHAVGESSGNGNLSTSPVVVADNGASEERKRDEQRPVTRSKAKRLVLNLRKNSGQPGRSSSEVPKGLDLEAKRAKRKTSSCQEKPRNDPSDGESHSDNSDFSGDTASDYEFPSTVFRDSSSDEDRLPRSKALKRLHTDVTTEDELNRGEMAPGYGESSTKRQYTYRKRAKGKTLKKGPAVKGWSQMLNSIDSAEYTSWDCCKKLRCFQAVDTFYLNQQRRIILNANQIDRKQYLTQMLDDDGRFFFNHKQVCTFFLLKAFRFSKDMQRGVKKAGRAPIAAVDPSRRNALAEQRDLILEFLQEMKARTANEMPDKTESHLPFYLKGQVYDLLVQRCENDAKRGVDKGIPSYSYFTSIWKHNLPELKVRKVQKFAKCTDCEIAKDQLSKYHTDKEKCNDINRRHSSHLVHVNLERAGYASRVRMAETEPDRVCSIAIDGADQHSYGLPHFVGDVKTTRGESLKVKLVGLLEHGVPHKLHLFTMTAEFPTGANHVIEVLHRWINKKVDSGHLPSTLFLQVDNCWRENKNRYVFGYLECLVAWGVFTEVQVSFLPVGHTHIDIDQRFSRTTTYLRKRPAITLEDLQDLLRRSHNPPPTVQSLNQIANISALFEQESSILQFHGISSFRFFRLVRGKPLRKNPRARYKTFCMVKKNQKDGWFPMRKNNPTVGFLKSLPDLKLTPKGELRPSDKKSEVLKRIESEEVRINDERKAAALRELYEKVYSNRDIPFHWNLKQCVEMKALRGRYRIPLTAEPSSFDLRKYVRVNKFSYSVNSFVIVNPKNATKDCPFWVGQVQKLIRNDFGDISGLAIHWYEPEGTEDVFKAKYTPSFCGKGAKSVPFIEEVVTDAVMFEVSRLNSDNTLSMATIRMIDAELPAQVHTNNHGD